VDVPSDAAPQLPILLSRQIDIVAASTPCPNAVLERRHVLRVASHHERAKPVQGGEAIVACLLDDESSAIGFYKVNPPEAGVAVIVHQDAVCSRLVGVWVRHGNSVGEEKVNMIRFA
jgi:hypothetical protein